MKRITRLLAVLVVFGVALPLTAVARGNEPTDTPDVSRSPRAEVSHSPEPSESPEASETPDVREHQDITVPPGLEKAAAKLASESSDLRSINVDAADKLVEVSYRLRARLFGIIPVPFDLQAKVDTKNKTVEAHGPWWLIFASHNVPAVQASLSADTTLTTQTNQGQILSRIISILKALATH